jgi:hypothetical protein
MTDMFKDYLKTFAVVLHTVNQASLAAKVLEKFKQEKMPCQLWLTTTDDDAILKIAKHWYGSGYQPVCFVLVEREALGIYELIHNKYITLTPLLPVVMVQSAKNLLRQTAERMPILLHEDDDSELFRVLAEVFARITLPRALEVVPREDRQISLWSAPSDWDLQRKPDQVARPSDHADREESGEFRLKSVAS